MQFPSVKVYHDCSSNYACKFCELLVKIFTIADLKITFLVLENVFLRNLKRKLENLLIRCCWPARDAWGQNTVRRRDKPAKNRSPLWIQFSHKVDGDTPYIFRYVLDLSFLLVEDDIRIIIRAYRSPSTFGHQQHLHLRVKSMASDLVSWI
jgi:hypothetical protein